MRWLLAAALILSAPAHAAPPTAAFYSDDGSTALVIGCVANQTSVMIVSADLQRSALPPQVVGSYAIDNDRPQPIVWTGITGGGLQTFNESFLKSLLRGRRVILEAPMTGPLSFALRNVFTEMTRVSSACGSAL